MILRFNLITLHANGGANLLYFRFLSDWWWSTTATLQPLPLYHVAFHAIYRRDDSMQHQKLISSHFQHYYDIDDCFSHRNGLDQIEINSISVEGSQRRLIFIDLAPESKSIVNEHTTSLSRRNLLNSLVHCIPWNLSEWFRWCLFALRNRWRLFTLRYSYRLNWLCTHELLAIAATFLCMHEFSNIASISFLHP